MSRKSGRSGRSGKRKSDTRPMWAADCETDPFKHGRIPKPFAWGIYTGLSYHQFWTVEEFVEFIRDQDVIIYFHNGGRFDLHFLLEHINLGEEVKVIGGRLVVAHIGKAELRDSWNLMPVKLAEFGGKLDIDIRKLEPDIRDQHMPEILTYLKADCVSLWEAVDNFERTYGRHLTMAGASLAQWKEISGLKAPKTDAAFFDRFSPYYYGGRVQCFEKGVIDGPLEFVDIRSAYPRAMLEEHPYEPDYVTIHRPKSITPQSMVTLECISNGALPYRNERGAIIFPDDNVKRVYHVTGHEVFAGLETGTIRDVKYIKCVDFTHKVSFAPYITKFYEKRKLARRDGNVFETVFCKLFMNNLYGKMAANPRNYGNFMCVEFQHMNEYKDDGYTFDGMIGPYALLRAPLEFWQENFLNVATAASITGWVRAYLWRQICKSDRPIYCDTDSLLCARANAEYGEELGEWNLEGIVDRAWIAGKKLYYLEGRFEKGAVTKHASKGVNLKMSDIRDRAGKRAAIDAYDMHEIEGKKIAPEDAIKKAAEGELVVFNADAPTFSVNTKPRFQTRRVRRT